MIPTVLRRSRRPCVAVSGGMDSVVVLDMVRKHQPDIEVLVFRQDFTSEQWGIIENLIRLWDLTVFAPPPRASYLIPNGPDLARVDEYDVGSATIPVIRDLVHADDRCVLDLGTRFLPISPLDFDCMFVGSRASDGSVATGQVLPKAVNRINGLEVIAPIYYWTDNEVQEAAKNLPYSRECYEERDERYDTGNLIACSRCLQAGNTESVACPKLKTTIPGIDWDQQKMLKTFREKFSFIGE